MADVTVKQLAETVGRSVEVLLAQMKEAGLSHASADASVNDAEKQQLLAHLKRAHGEQAGQPQKITLQRKTVTTLKTAQSSGGRGKTVNVEVRKTRTYVKRSLVEEQEEQAREVAEKLRLEQEAKLRQEEDARMAAAAAERQAIENARIAQAEEEARKAAEEARRQQGGDAKDSARKLSVPKVDLKRAETPEERARREEELVRERAAEEQRRKQEDALRKEAEEKARLKTLEQAQRIAEELAHRPDAGVVTPSVDAPLAKGLVGKAYEESFDSENRAIKRGTATPPRGGKKGPKSRAEQAFRPVTRALTSTLSKKHGFERPVEKQVYEVTIGETILVSDLAQQMAKKTREVVRVLMKMGEIVTADQRIDQATAALVVEEMGHTSKFVSETAVEDSLRETIVRDGEAKNRAPVVTIMGHVDHGKTSLLDHIRRAKVASGEAGGITQHIGAYHVETPRGMITFMDTPGHAAFTAMRARGAKATDIVILVVAADDGVMPQTEEAINHARASGVPLIVAINKMDKESADVDRVLSELSAKQVIAEDWGGDTQVVKVSAHTGQGIDELLEAILNQAELLELTAVEEGPAQGVVIESRIEKGRGAVATLLVQRGTLKKGDLVLAGTFYGRARALNDENGKPVKHIGPSMPVEILGLPEAPMAGDEFLVVADERKAREVAEFRQTRDRQLLIDKQESSRLENLFANMGKKEAATVNLVLRTDVRGSLEALSAALNDLGNEEVRVKIVSSGVGAISLSDVTLAESTGSVVLGFNVRADNSARAKCQEDGIDLRYYSIIYELIDDVRDAMSGLLSPERRENIVGIAEVREVFHSSKFGSAAGCMVLEGSLFRNKPIRVLREDVVVFQGELESLRRFKDDVAEVRNGMECGLAVKGYKDVQAGDKIEVYEVQVIKRSL
ncbi:MAG: translation initiation factor IF-2 [Moraxellaceae bacterium]|nr:translation initiation factor IF-2 [Moraxellaceae bacterium]